MRFEERCSIPDGNLDVYVGRDKVSVAKLHSNGEGYSDVQTFKRFIEEGKGLGYNPFSNDWSWVVTDEALEFDGLSRKGNLIYSGHEGQIVLSANPGFPELLSVRGIKSHTEH